MKKTTGNYLRQRIHSFGYAFEGIKTLFTTESHAKIHALAFMAVLGLGYYCEVSAIEWAILLLTCGVVMAGEAFNTSLEALTDLVSPDYHHLAKKVKDVAAAAVLLLAITAVFIGFIIFLPKLFLK